MQRASDRWGEGEVTTVRKENKKLRIALVSTDITFNEIINIVKEHGHAEDILSRKLGELLNITNELPERTLYEDPDVVK